MNPLALVNAEKLYSELRSIDDAYRDETGYYLDFCTEYREDLLSGYKPYAQHLEEGFLRGGVRREYSAAAFNKRIQAARSRIRFAFAHFSSFRDAYKRVQLEDYFRQVPNRRVSARNEQPREALAWPEVRRLVSDCQDRTIKLMIAFLAQTGVCISEMLSIAVSDLQAESDHYSIRVAGGKKTERVVAATREIIDAIQRHCEGTTWLFEHDQRRYNRIAVTNRIKIQSLRVIGKEISAQTLRQAWIVEQLRVGRGILATKKYLGHGVENLALGTGSTSTLSADEAMLPLTI